MRGVSAAVWMAIAALSAAGCDDPDADRVITVQPEELCESVDPATAIWESAPWADPACPWIDYPSEAAVVVPHSLGREPRVVLPYLSFHADGTDSTLASGNIAQVLDVDDATVTLANATEQAFFLRLVLE
ncbi:MAG: hypothetical protein ACOC9O_00325 [Myxococcota bacterium]